MAQDLLIGKWANSTRGVWIDEPCGVIQVQFVLLSGVSVHLSLTFPKIDQDNTDVIVCFNQWDLDWKYGLYIDYVELIPIADDQ